MKNNLYALIILNWFLQDFEYTDFTVQYLTIELGKLLPRENLH